MDSGRQVTHFESVTLSNINVLVLVSRKYLRATMNRGQSTVTEIEIVEKRPKIWEALKPSSAIGLTCLLESDA